MATREELRASQLEKAAAFVKQVDQIKAEKNVSVADACKELGSNVSRYYNCKTSLGEARTKKNKTKTKGKRKYTRRNTALVPTQTQQLATRRTNGGFHELPPQTTANKQERQVVFFSGPESLAALLVQTLANRQ